MGPPRSEFVLQLTPPHLSKIWKDDLGYADLKFRLDQFASRLVGQGDLNGNGAATPSFLLISTGPKPVGFMPERGQKLSVSLFLG